MGGQKLPKCGVGPSGRTGSGYWIDRLPGVLLLKLYRADIAESGVEPSGIVDAVDELGKIFDDVGECLERHWIDALDLETPVREPACQPSARARRYALRTSQADRRKRRRHRARLPETCRPRSGSGYGRHCAASRARAASRRSDTPVTPAV